MLSDEEKKAIKDCDIIFINLEDMMSEEGANNYKKSYKILKNLIEKQQKEIEELKQDRDEYKEEYIKLQNARYYNYISKDKIKAKIEELEKEQEDNRKVLYNAVNNLCFKEIDKICNRISVNMAIRDILQSLLEKE